VRDLSALDPALARRWLEQNVIKKSPGSLLIARQRFHLHKWRASPKGLVGGEGNLFFYW
jgi:hypothetical protein